MPDPISVQAFRRGEPGSPSQSRLGSVPDIDALVRNSRIIWGAIAAMAVAAILAFRAAKLSFAWTSGGTFLICVVVFLAVSGFYRRFRPDPSITFGTECCVQLALVLSLGCALSYPLAAAGFPYRDAALNAADTWMGLDWRAYLHFINDRPLLGTLMHLAYNSMIFQFLFLIVSLAAPSRLVRLQQYIFATALALAVTLVVFAFVPAGGIYTFLKIQPNEFANLSPIMTTDQILRLDALRSGEHRIVSEMAGLITFPSFHTVWAILFMWGFYPIKQLRFGAIYLNLLVIASTPIQGAHYFIDLFGGAIVAAIAIYGATRLMRPARSQTTTISAEPTVPNSIGSQNSSSNIPEDERACEYGSHRTAASRPRPTNRPIHS